MKGVLVLAHGSKMAETHLIIEKVAQMLQEKLGDTPMELAYMQFSEDNLEKAVKKLADKGVTHIRAVPYFLFSGMHIKNIHDEMDRVLEAFPNISASISDSLGADDRLAEILFDRANG